MGHYIENATTRRARVLVYAGTEMISVTDLTGSGLLPCKYVMHSEPAYTSTRDRRVVAFSI